MLRLSLKVVASVNSYGENANGMRSCEKIFLSKSLSLTP